MFNILSAVKPDFLNYTTCEGTWKTLFGKLLKKAPAGLGALAPDECYGFVRALAAGGKESVNNREKVRLLEDLTKPAKLPK